MLAYFKIQACHLSGEAEENQENLNQNCWSVGRDSNPEIPGPEVRVIVIRSLQNSN